MKNDYYRRQERDGDDVTPLARYRSRIAVTTPRRPYGTYSRRIIPTSIEHLSSTKLSTAVATRNDQGLVSNLVDAVDGID